MPAILRVKSQTPTQMVSRLGWHVRAEKLKPRETRAFVALKSMLRKAGARAAENYREKTKTLSLKSYDATGLEDEWFLDEILESFETFGPQAVIDAGRDGVAFAGKTRGAPRRVLTGVNFDVENPRVQEALENLSAKFVVNVTDGTRALVSRILTGLEASSKTTPEIADALAESFAFSPGRAARIARTETNSASNLGNFLGYVQAGVSRKEWISDPAAADFPRRHDLVNGQIVGIDEPFVVNDGELMQPGDMNGNVDDVVSCRCTMLPLFD